ncbi:hypothetical protein V6N12_046621 [Hibiscus sabdariffa]|uniref:Uncharacterized protein n=1 Tax=Hibiscus sabdariffa TaxID=183260 RepID=A0ABR2DM16_9ROSI
MTGAIILALMHRIPSELCSQACLGGSSTRMGDLLGSPRAAPLFLNSAVKPAWARVVLGWVTSWKSSCCTPIFGLGTAVSVTSNSTVKRAWARVVLGWVTSWEVLVLHPYFWFGNGRFSDIALVGAAYKDGVMYGSSKFVTQEMTGAIIPALMHRIPSELRTLVGAVYKDGVMYGSSKFVTQEKTGAIIPALMHRIPSELHTLVGAVYKDGVMYGSSKFVTQEMTGAIIPALMHRIPSELRSQAYLGESSTRMGDLLGSPRVAPLFLNSAVKRACARVVLGWVTSREVLVLHPYFWFGNGRFSDIVKRACARVVLGWVTSWEVLVLHPYFWFGNGRFSDIGAAYKDEVMYGSSNFVTQEMTGVIIPALMHRIPSELRS